MTNHPGTKCNECSAELSKCNYCEKKICLECNHYHPKFVGYICDQCFESIIKLIYNSSDVPAKLMETDNDQTHS